MWRIQGGWVSPAFETSTNPMRTPWREFEWNEFIPCLIQGIAFPNMLQPGVTKVTFFSFWSPSLWKSSTILPWWPPWPSPHSRDAFQNLVHEPRSLIVLRCCFVSLHHKSLKGIKEGQKFLGVLFASFWLIFSSWVSNVLSTFGRFWACLPPLPLMGWFKRTNKESPSLLDSSKKCKSTCTSNSSLGSGTCSFSLFLFGVKEVFLLVNPHLF